MSVIQEDAIDSRFKAEQNDEGRKAINHRSL